MVGPPAGPRASPRADLRICPRCGDGPWHRRVSVTDYEDERPQSLRHRESQTMRRALAHVMIAAVFALTFSAGVAVADPPGLKTLAIGAAAPDFRLPGVDGKTYTPRGLRRRQGPGRRLHLQPLPDRPGLRGPGPRAARRLQGQGRRPRRHLARTTRWRSGSTSWATPTWATRSRT